MRVLQVCAELFPLVKSGGLADACTGLSKALLARGVDTRVLMPAFGAARRGTTGLDRLPPRSAADGFTLWRGRTADAALTLYLVDTPGWRSDDERPYAAGGGAQGARIFAALGRAAAALAAGADPDWSPHVVHAHDWHAGLAPACLLADRRSSGRRGAASVFTIHNLAYQGNHPPSVQGELALHRHAGFDPAWLAHHGQLSFMKAGLVCADQVTTVSPTYASEVLQPEHGCGFDVLLRARAPRLRGILNGVDAQVWNPSRDPFIAARYDARTLERKRECRAALQRRFGLAPQSQAPLFAMASRLAHQKGIDLVLQALPALLAGGAQLVVLGEGDAALADALRQAAARHPGALGLRIGYDEPSAHAVIAGADVVMMPSRFEPCGLTQLYAMAYGSLPLVRRVGGLADTVDGSDAGTGFVFDRFDVHDLLDAAGRARALHARSADWRAAQQRAMSRRFDWHEPAACYEALYRASLPALQAQRPARRMKKGRALADAAPSEVRLAAPFDQNECRTPSSQPVESLPATIVGDEATA